MLARVRESIPGARLIYVGDGQLPGDGEAVERASRALSLEHAVTITGFVDYQQAINLTEKAEICFSVFPNEDVLLSASPTKLVEYLALGKCVVCNDHPEQTKVMSESGAGRSVQWTTNEFAAEVIRIVKNPDRGYFQGQS